MSKQKIPGIDGLRAIAVLAVITYHSFPQLCPGGFTGVDIFFVSNRFTKDSGSSFRSCERRPRVLVHAVADADNGCHR